MGRYPGRVASCVSLSCQRRLPLAGGSLFPPPPRCLSCSGLECKGERLLLWLSWLEAEVCGGAVQRGSSLRCADGVAPRRQQLTWETRAHFGPCIFPGSLLRSDLFSLSSCAGLGSPQGPSCLETFPHWSDFGMDDTHSDSPDEPAEPLGGRREVQ